MTLAEFQWNCCVAGDISVLFVVDFMAEDFFNNLNDSNDCTAYAFRFLHFVLRPRLFRFWRPDLFHNHRSYYWRYIYTSIQIRIYWILFEAPLLFSSVITLLKHLKSCEIVIFEWFNWILLFISKIFFCSMHFQTTKTIFLQFTNNAQFSTVLFGDRKWLIHEITRPVHSTNYILRQTKNI